MSKKKRNSRKTGPSLSKSLPGPRAIRHPLFFMLGGMLVLLAVFLYVNTLSHDYALDDHGVIESNWVTQKGFGGISTHLTTNYRYGYWAAKGTLYRPLPNVWMAIQWQIAPNAPSFYHLISVLMYALTTWLLFRLLARLIPGKNLILPFLITAIFAAHPIHTEVVANIKSQDEMLAFLFCLLSMTFLMEYAWGKKKGPLILSLFCYTLGLFSKESVITFLAIFPLLLYFFTEKKWNWIGRTSALFLIPAAVYLAARKAVLGNVTAGSSEISVLDNVISLSKNLITEKATAIYLSGRYLYKLIIPYELVSDKGYPATQLMGVGDWQVWLSLLAFAGLIYLAFIGWKKKKKWSFGILFGLISFSIYSNVFIPIGSSYGERFLYIPSVGFAIGIAYLMQKFLGTETSGRQANLSAWVSSHSKVLTALGILVLLYGYLTVQRNPAWKDSFTLYQTDVQKEPDCAKLQYHYGLEVMKKGVATNNVQEKSKLIDASVVAFNKAVELYPRYADAYGELGLAFFRKNNFTEAIKNYEKSLEINPNYANVYSNMGIIYFNQKNLTKAQEVYENAVRLNPRFADARRNLGSVFAMQNKHQEAIEQFLAGLQVAPNDPAINQYISLSYQAIGDEAKAAHYRAKAAALK